MFHALDFLVLCAFFLVQARITLLLWRAASRRFHGGGRTLAHIAIVLFDLLLLFGYLLSFSALLSAWRMPPRVGAYLAAAALDYLLLSTAILAIRACLSLIARRLPPAADPGRRRLLETGGRILTAAPAAVLAYGTFVERLNFQVREVDLPIPDLPPDLEGLRILQLSDIHRGAFLSGADLERVVDAARELRSHLAVITGDLISSRGDPLDSCIRELSRIHADAGVFGCMGNHEHYADAADYTEAAAARVGIHFLRSRAQPLRFGSARLNLAGVDHQPTWDKPKYLRGAETLVEPGAVNVLLSHNPDVFPVAARQGYNLLLAGHTHGGQVSIEIFDRSINPARFITPYVYGVYRADRSTAYVTRGIGSIGLPARIGAPPEISALRLRKA